MQRWKYDLSFSNYLFLFDLPQHLRRQMGQQHLCPLAAVLKCGDLSILIMFSLLHLLQFAAQGSIFFSAGLVQVSGDGSGFPEPLGLRLKGFYIRQQLGQQRNRFGVRCRRFVSTAGVPRSSSGHRSAMCA